MNLGGSSPRVRGTHSRTANAPRGSIGRFIPARAGNSHKSPRSTLHPRACGEPVIARTEIGSSPRVRGTPDQSCSIVVAEFRFIPARAGNSGSLRLIERWGHQPVHPRACGELLVQLRSYCWFSTASAIIRRFIPARAGNSLLSPAIGGPRPSRFIPARAGNS